MKKVLYFVACMVFFGMLSCSEDDNDVTNSTGENSGKSTEEQKKDPIIEDVEKAFAMATIVDVETPGTLSTALPASKKYSTKSLKIRGAINGTDIVYLHDMMRNATGGELYALDLSECYIAEGGDCYYIRDGIDKYYTKDNVVGIYMFTGCDLLRYIKIPAKTISIKRMAFYKCTQLMYVDIGKTVQEIESEAFSGIYTEEDYERIERGDTILKPIINISDIASWCSMKHWRFAPERLFLNNEEIEKLEIPDGVKIINRYSFASCGKLNSVSIPSSVKIICMCAFKGCYSLKSLAIPVGVDTIEISAFYNSGLSSISISSSVKVFRGYEGDFNPFTGCKDLSTIVVDENNPLYDSRDHCNAIIDKKNNSLLYGCKGTVIPNSVTNIKKRAFNRCSGLISISIPPSVTSIEYDAFYCCTGLASIKVESGNPIFDSRDNCNAIIETESNNLKLGCKNTVIPNSVTSIGAWSFYGCSDLTSITIPNSVTSIGASSFYGCSGLTSITIPNSVTSIGAASFYGCSGLISITIPNGVTVINNDAFEGCSGLTSITIPNSVTSIGYEAFSHCDNLASVKSYIKNPGNVTLNNGCFPKNNATLYVPKGTIEEYKSSKWSNYFDKIEEGDY